MAVKTMVGPDIKSVNKVFDRAFANMMIAMAKSNAETDARIAKSRAETDAIIAETAAIIAETDAKMTKSRAETDLAIQSLTKTVDRLSVRVDKLAEKIDKVTDTIPNFGVLENRLGQLIEFTVAPGIRQAMNDKGHKLGYVTANKIFYGIIDGKKRTLTEVDLYLRNGSEVLAVEVKTTLTLGWVKEHLERLIMLRDNEIHTKIQNKVLYGAVAGVFIHEDAKKYALKHGLYVIQILEDKNKLEIIEPPRKCRAW